MSELDLRSSVQWEGVTDMGTKQEQELSRVRRVGHVTIATPDIAKQVEYYTSVLGLMLVDRTAHRAVLATPSGQEAVVLELGYASHCKSLGLQVSPKCDLEQLGSWLSTHGIDWEPCHDVTPGVSHAIAFDDPNGVRLELFADSGLAEMDASESGIQPFKLGHVAFISPDVRKTVDFYTEVLGFKISDWRGDFFAFMRCCPDHHSVNFVQGDAISLHHVAFEVRDSAEIQRACDYLAKKEIKLVLGPIRHIIGHNIAIYHKNNDQLLVELFTEIDQMKDEELGYFDPRPWHQDRPQRPKTWGPHTLTNYWGPGRLVSRDP